MSTLRVLHPHPVAEPLKFSEFRSNFNPLLTMPQVKTPPRFCPPTAYLQRRNLYSSPGLSSSPASSSVPTTLRSCLRRNSSGGKKKTVRFADPLTVEHLFTSEPSSPTPTQVKGPCPRLLEGQENPENKIKFRLAFSQPKTDLRTFVAHLQERRVQMESCSISEGVLSGEVCVYHFNPIKTVTMKMTSDSQMSPKDIPCKFLEKRLCKGLDLDVFSFETSLPQNEQLEFHFTFRPGKGFALFFDDNMGQNYKVLQEKDRSSAGMDKQFYPNLSQHKSNVLTKVPYCYQRFSDLKYIKSNLLGSRTFEAFTHAVH
ncbi:protein phosphatase 1 regulatory subunit 3B [Fundulus diaphanus]